MSERAAPGPAPGEREHAGERRRDRASMPSERPAPRGAAQQLGNLYGRIREGMRTMCPPRLPTPLRLLAAPAAVAVVAFVQWALLPDPSIAPFAFLSVSVPIAAWLGGRLAGLLTVVLAALVADYVFMPPLFDWAVSTSAHRSLLMFVVGATPVALLCSALRDAIVEAARGADILQRHADLMRLSYDAILVWRPGGAIESWNRGAEELYGYSAFEAEGRVSHGLLKTVFPVSLAAVETALRQEGRWEGTLVHRTKDDQAVTVAARLQLVVGHDGVERVLETNRDVTERRRIEEEREQLLESERAARSEAERVARMRDEFVATVSHELRTPLNAILGWAAMLRKGTLDAVATARALEVVERNAHAQAQLVEDLLDMSRILSGKLRFDVRRVDLGAVVESALATVLPAAHAKGVRVDKMLDSGAGAVQGDPSRLEQVVSNLLTNAVKFTPRDGRVHVVLHRRGSRAEIIVRDTGQGIAPDLLPHVFDRFRQGDSSITRKHAGLGLGLALVKHLVEQHGGDVRAESEGVGSGATFVVSLPIAAAIPEEREGLTPLDACESLASVKVLVVDDEEDARDLVRRILADCDAEVIAVGSASEALDEVPRFRPDVLVSDIGMPEMDGYHLMRALRSLPHERGGKTPAIALTAFARPEDRLRALRVGYQMHLAKPIDQAELIVVVASIAGRTAAEKA